MENLISETYFPNECIEDKDKDLNIDNNSSNEDSEKNKPEIIIPLDYISEKIDENDKIIRDYAIYFENQRQDIENIKGEIISKLEFLSNNYENFDNSFSTKVISIIQNFIESITKSKEIIRTLDDLNMIAQNINYKLDKRDKNSQFLKTEHIENFHKYNQLRNEFDELEKKYIDLRRNSVKNNNIVIDKIRKKLNEEINNLNTEKDNIYNKYNNVVIEYEKFKTIMQKNISAKFNKDKIISELKFKIECYERNIQKLKNKIKELSKIIDEENNRKISNEEAKNSMDTRIMNEEKVNYEKKGVDLYTLLTENDNDENKKENIVENNNNDPEILNKKYNSNREASFCFIRDGCKKKKVKNYFFVSKINTVSLLFNIFIILLLFDHN